MAIDCVHARYKMVCFTMTNRPTASFDKVYIEINT